MSNDTPTQPITEPTEAPEQPADPPETAEPSPDPGPEDAHPAEPDAAPDAAPDADDAPPSEAVARPRAPPDASGRLIAALVAVLCALLVGVYLARYRPAWAEDAAIAAALANRNVTALEALAAVPLGERARPHSAEIALALLAPPPAANASVHERFCAAHHARRLYHEFLEATSAAAHWQRDVLRASTDAYRRLAVDPREAEYRQQLASLRVAHARTSAAGARAVGRVALIDTALAAMERPLFAARIAEEYGPSPGAIDAVAAALAELYRSADFARAALSVVGSLATHPTRATVTTLTAGRYMHAGLRDVARRLRAARADASDRADAAAARHVAGEVERVVLCDW